MGKLRKNDVEVLDALPRPDFRISFHTKEEEVLIRRLQKIPERRAVRILFERHGCLRCRTHSMPHAGNGFCSKCRAWIYHELGKIDKEIARGDLR